MSMAQQHRLIGQVIAERYRVMELLAEGGMGAVYIADHLTLHKQVALKIVHPEHAGNAELVARFEREAMATSRIDHPNVVAAIDFGTLNDGTAYLAVQLVRGPSLTRVLTEHGRMPWQRAASVGAQIADALWAAHGHGIIHRDLKPDNVLLQSRDDGSELVKVLDFGVAKFSSESKVPLSARTDVTQIGMVVGTPGYMAPEQTIGNPADERSDLYGLGVMLWESLVGEPLWAAVDLQALVEKQMSETPKPVREASGDGGIPEGLENLVMRLLARRAEDRPGDAASVRDALREYVGDTSQRWRTGERPVIARSSEYALKPGSGELVLREETVELDLEAHPIAGLSPAQVRTPVLPHSVAPPPRNTPTKGPLKPSVPPPPPPSIRSTRRLRSSRAAWGIASMLGLIVAVAFFLILTGRLQLKPAGEIAEIASAAEKVALDLDLDDEPASATAHQASVDTGLPAALVPAFDKLAYGGNKDERNEGIEALLGHQPASEVPEYVRHMALLQRAKTCEAKRDELEALAKLDDPRALPVLQRLADRPRNGCGKKKKDDCFACLRKPLGALLKKLDK
ncbi:MAG TPA: serine/threonine-protein kinase [Polyangiales bacterium]|nr:serine/threonine-protein kinase [Polyangiales bacterium]